jgi:hypothetical protein
MGVDPVDQEGDTRQVKYWLTMSLPTLWAQPPADAGRNEIYLYRPDFYQDQDGIERRIALWLDPSIRASEATHLQEALNHRPSLPAAGPDAVAAAPIPAVPAAHVRSSDPFASPFEDSFHTSASKTPSASTKAPLSAAGAPVGVDAAPANTNGSPASLPLAR